MKEFTVGHVYFMVSFLETKLVYPIVTAFVYLGKDLLKDETEETWYFQDTASYAEHGAFTDGRSNNAQVLTFKASNLDDVLDVPGLCDVLMGAAAGRLTQI
jgi:hypothetical protein